MKSKTSIIFLVLFSTLLWAEDIDVEILRDLDFFMDMDSIEQMEELQEISIDENAAQEFLDAVKEDSI